MKYRIFFIVLISFSLYSAAVDSAEVLYEKGRYSDAITLLRTEGDQKDPEVPFRIGWYAHYLAYDSRPFEGDLRFWSDSVVSYLDRAIELKEGWFGDAQYFLGAEYGARAMDSLRSGSAEGFIAEYRAGMDKGCYPPWFTEYGRNLLASCATNAILFVVGDFQYNSTQVVQHLEDFRKDVTVIPMGYMLGRPWFVQRLRDGLSGVLVPAPIGWSDREIMNIRPYKWQSHVIDIEPPELYYKFFKIKNPFLWELEPDMIAGERRMLSPWRAVLAEIVEENAFERPIYITYGWTEGFYSGLYPYTMDLGIVRRLLPFTTGGTEWEANWYLIEYFLIKNDGLSDLNTVDTLDMPRISPLLRTYHRAVYSLANHYLEIGEEEKARDIIEFIKRKMSVGEFSQ